MCSLSSDNLPNQNEKNREIVRVTIIVEAEHVVMHIKVPFMSWHQVEHLQRQNESKQPLLRCYYISIKRI
jgi:hypothetical protein